MTQEKTEPAPRDGTEALVPPPGGSGELSVLDLAIVLVQNLRLIVLAPLVIGLIALAYTYTITPTFTATAKLLLPQQQNSAAAAALATQLGALAGLAGAAGIKNPSDTYIAMMKSRTVADRLIARFKLRDVYEKKTDTETRMSLAARTEMFSGKDSLISVSVDDHDPRRSADIANAYVDELRNLTQTLAMTEAAQRRLFFEKQTRQAKDDLVKSEIALRSSGISEATLRTAPYATFESLARLKAQITAQEVKISSQRSYLTDTSPDIARAQQELGALRAQLAKSEQTDTLKPGGSGIDYITNFRDYKYHEALFEIMAKQAELAKLDEAREGTVIQVVDAALPPEQKSKPRKGLIAMLTTLVAFILVLLFVFTRQVLRGAEKNPATAGKMAVLRGSLRLSR